jgi:F-box protein 18 (helicase)
MEDLPSDILGIIFKHMSISDIKQIKKTCTSFKEVCKYVYPYLQRFLEHTTCNIPPCNPLDHVLHMSDYEQIVSSLHIDNIAQIGLYLRQINKHKGLAYNYEYILKKYDHYKIDFKQKHITPEQNNIIRCKPKKQIISVQAFAGTGKTTTLESYAKTWNKHSILYLAYNNALANETKKRFENMPNVTVLTCHALALKHTNIPPDMINNFTVKDIKTIYPEKTHDECHQFIHEVMLFCTTTERTIPENMQKLWDMVTTSSVHIPHDVYLKQYQLTKPTLQYDIIMIDESQDCTATILDIVLSQYHSTRILVGDIYQQIYKSFRNVIDPYEYIRDMPHQSFSLTKSFRMGFDAIFITNKFLQFYLHAPGVMVPGKRDTFIDTYDSLSDLPTGTYVISRKNITMYKNAFTTTKTVHLYGKTFDFDEEIDASTQLLHLLNENYMQITNKLLLKLKTVNELYVYCRQNGETHWLHRIQVVLEYREQTMNRWNSLRERCTDIDHAELIFTTTHQSKGCEYDVTALSGDFCEMNTIEERNILYVAMTRCKQTMYISNKLKSMLEKVRGNVFTLEKTPTNITKKLCECCRRVFTKERIYLDVDVNSIIGKDNDIFIKKSVCVDCQPTY